MWFDETRHRYLIILLAGTVVQSHWSSGFSLNRPNHILLELRVTTHNSNCRNNDFAIKVSSTLNSLSMLFSWQRLSWYNPFKSQFPMLSTTTSSTTTKCAIHYSLLSYSIWGTVRDMDMHAGFLFRNVNRPCCARTLKLKLCWKLRIDLWYLQRTENLHQTWISSRNRKHSDGFNDPLK